MKKNKNADTRKPIRRRIIVAKPTVSGIYSSRGYDIHVDGEKVYEAGNNVNSSAVADSVPTNSPCALSIRKIRAMCIATVKEIVREVNGQYYGVEAESIEE